MELKKIVTISGKGGLFHVLKPAKNAIIVESIDDQKIRTTVPTSARVSVLQEVAVYTLNADGSTPLAEVLKLIQAKYPEGLEIDIKKTSDADLRAFILDILPDYNASKVYISDIKKLITWYNILLKYAPEVFSEVTEEVATEEAENKEEVQA